MNSQDISTDRPATASHHTATSHRSGPGIRHLASLAIGCWLAGVAASSSGAAPAISSASLLDDMTNLAGMAEFPSPAYT